MIKLTKVTGPLKAGKCASSAEVPDLRVQACGEAGSHAGGRDGGEGAQTMGMRRAGKHKSAVQQPSVTSRYWRKHATLLGK